jgi:hypothetical protein
MKKVFLAIALLCFASSAFAVQTATYGWEDGNTVLGTYGTPVVSNDSTMAKSGSRSLKMVDDYSGSGTPQAYVAWIKDLAEGDQVTASFWVYDVTISSPSGRIWGHYNDSASDVNQYDGSASGNSTYSGPNGWTYLSYTWTIASPHTGLVVEARTYSDGLDTIWVDDLTVTAPDSATIVLVPEPGAFVAFASGLIGLVGFVGRKRTP